MRDLVLHQIGHGLVHILMIDRSHRILRGTGRLRRTHCAIPGHRQDAIHNALKYTRARAAVGPLGLAIQFIEIANLRKRAEEPLILAIRRFESPPFVENHTPGENRSDKEQ